MKRLRLALTHSALWQLSAERVRLLIREPGSILWPFAVPLVLAVILAVVTQSKPLEPLAVCVADEPGGAQLEALLRDAGELQPRRVSREEAHRLLRQSRCAALVIPGQPPEIIADPTQQPARGARALVQLALARGQGPSLSAARETHSPVGSRYLDFFVPGMLGFNLFAGSMNFVSLPLVSMRLRKLLKNLSATPMRRLSFLAAFIAPWLLLAMVKVLFFVGWGSWLFGVELAGTLVELMVFALLGALCISGLGFLAGSRANTMESAEALQLITIASVLIGGVFFSTENFPDWLRAGVVYLPLNLVVDGVRAIWSEGAHLTDLGPQLLTLAGWGLVSTAIALKIFRWK